VASIYRRTTLWKVKLKFSIVRRNRNCAFRTARVTRATHVSGQVHDLLGDDHLETGAVAHTLSIGIGAAT